MGTQTVSTVESEAAALHRLAQQARDKGVEIVIDEDNRHWATSASRPGERYVVSLLACSCAGFVRWGRCHHFALCLAEYFCLPPLDPDPTPDGGTRVLPVPAKDVTEDVVVLVQPARHSRPVVEGSWVAYAGTREDGSTYRIMHADAVVIDGVLHRVGDAVMVTDRRWGWVSARITAIRTVGATGRVWKVDVDGSGHGETTRSLAEVRAVNVVVMDEEVQSAA